MVSNDIIKKVYDNATPIQQKLFASSDFHQKLDELATKYNLQSKEQTTLFIFTVGDIVLGLYKIADTVPLLQQELGIDPRTAALLGADVLEFLAPLSNPNWQPPVEEETVEPEVATPAVAVTVTAASIPAVAPVAAPEPLHTYAEDLSTARGERVPSYQPTTTPAREPSYVSTQSDIRPPLSQIPTYNTPLAPIAPVSAAPAANQPRWSSDN